MSRLALAVLFSGLFVCVLSTQGAPVNQSDPPQPNPTQPRPNSKCGGYTLYKDAGGYLMYHEIPVTFNDAKKRCAVEGAVLASPINDEIKAAMMDILWKTRKVKNSVFTGFSSKPNDGGVFSSIEGTQLSNIEHTWAPNEPDNEDGRENCIVLSPYGTISEVNCNNRNPYFCFMSEERVTHVCGIKDGDYALDNTTGSCYKLHSNELGFDEAAKVCEQEGGHLAIINGDNEAQAAKNLLVKHNTKYAILGFQLIKNSGKWMTLQGETIEDAGYAKWCPGDNSSLVASAAPKNAYGLIDTDGFLRYSLDPSKVRPFICEKDTEIVVCE